MLHALSFLSLLVDSIKSTNDSVVRLEVPNVFSSLISLWYCVVTTVAAFNHSANCNYFVVLLKFSTE